MRLTHLEFRSFKGPDEKVDIPARGVIYGPNGSGKSRWRQAIRFALEGAVDDSSTNEHLFGLLGPNGGGAALTFANPEFHVDRELYRDKTSIRTRLTASGAESDATGVNEARILETIGNFPVRLDLDQFISMSEDGRRAFCMSLCASVLDTTDRAAAMVDRTLIEFFVEMYGDTVEGWAQGALEIDSLDDLFETTKRGKPTAAATKMRGRLIEHFRKKLEPAQVPHVEALEASVRNEIGATEDVTRAIRTVLKNLKATRAKAKKDHTAGTAESARHQAKRRDMISPPGSLRKLTADREKLEADLTAAREKLAAAEAVETSRRETQEDLTAAKAELDRIETELDTKRKELEAAVAAGPSDTAADIERIELEIEPIDSTERDLVSEKIATEEACQKDRRASLERLNREAKSLASRRQSVIDSGMKASGGISDIAKLADEVEAAEPSIKDLLPWQSMREAINKRLDVKRIAELRAQAKTLNAEVEQNDAAIEVEKTAIAGGEAELESLRARLTSIDAASKTTRDANAAREKELAGLRELLASETRARETLEKAIAGLQAQVPKKRDTVETLERRLARDGETETVEEIQASIITTEATLETKKADEQKKRDIVNLDELLATCQAEAAAAGVLFDLSGKMQKAFIRVREKFMDLVVSPLLDRVGHFIEAAYGDVRRKVFAKLESENGTPRFELGMEMPVFQEDRELVWRDVSWFAMCDGDACLFAAALVVAFILIRAESSEGLPFKAVMIETAPLDARSFGRLLAGIDRFAGELDNVLIFTHEKREIPDAWESVCLADRELVS